MLLWILLFILLLGPLVLTQVCMFLLLLRVDIHAEWSIVSNEGLKELINGHGEYHSTQFKLFFQCDLGLLVHQSSQLIISWYAFFNGLLLQVLCRTEW